MKSTVSLVIVGACALYVAQPGSLHMASARDESVRAAASVGAFVAKLPAPMRVSTRSACDPVTQPVAGSALLQVEPIAAPLALRSARISVVEPPNWWEAPPTGTTTFPLQGCALTNSWSTTVLSV